MISFEYLLRAAHWFFFTPESPLPVALVRISLSTLIFIDTILAWNNSEEWYGPNGIVSALTFARDFSHSRFSFYRFLPPRQIYVHIHLAFQLLFAMMLAIGLFSHVSALALFLLVISSQHRNPYIIYGADLVTRTMLFLLIFSQAGQILSLDSFIRWGTIARQNLQCPSWCNRLMQIQIVIIYFKSLLWKLRGQIWRNGEAVSYVLGNAKLVRHNASFSVGLGATAKMLTWIFLGVEGVLLPGLLIRQTRIYAVLAAILLHVTLDSVMTLHFFGVTMIVSLLIWLPPDQLQAFIK